MPRRLAAIMFTDIAGYTALAQKDEAAALRLLSEQERLVRPLLATHRGRKVKSMGDGLLIEFPNALDAVQCAVEFQRTAQERNVQGGVPPLRLRVGIHLGDVQRRGADILGDAVNIASRVEPLAEPEGVCLSAQVFDQVRNKVPYQFDRLGSKALKGVREPIEVYRIVLPWTVHEPPPTELAPPRLAVLPLVNISPDPKDEYFADGLTEELITVLSQIKGLRVISHTSINQYKGTTKPVAQIGTELGADSVLEGSVRKAGDQLRIAVQLIDARTDEHRWARTYDRKLENVFAIQAEVAEQAASALKVELLRSEHEAIQERPTSNLAAYESYLRAIQESHRIHAAEATKCFEEAIRLDPQFSAAYAYLAHHLLLLLGSMRSAQEVLPRARELVAKALELNPNSADAHSARGNLAFQGDHDWSRAELEFQQAIALNPSNATARFWYAMLLAVLQRPRESKKQYLAVIELDPLWAQVRANLCWTQGTMGDRSFAIEFGTRSLEAFPDSSTIRFTLAWQYAIEGRREEALQLIEPVINAPSHDFWTSPAAILAFLGRPERARAWLEDWEKNRSPQLVGLADAAAFKSILGDTEGALELFERDYREGNRALWAFYLDPWIDPIRENPRFRALLRAMNLPTTVPPRGPPKSAPSIEP